MISSRCEFLKVNTSIRSHFFSYKAKNGDSLVWKGILDSKGPHERLML